MSIRVEDFNSTDFSDITTGRRLRPPRPGDILLHDFMEPLGLSANALAMLLHVPTNRITGILAGTRGISADTALRLARHFGTTPQFWMNLQSNHDLTVTANRIGSQIMQEISLSPAIA